jgi:hypothetical protein
MRLRTAIAPVLALALAGCGEEALRTGPIDSRILHSLASVHVDPPAATAMLNAYRASRGLGPVRLDPALNAMAQRQADAMVAANALSHDVGGSFSSRLAGAGVDATEAGENVGGGYYSTEEALTGWRGSPEHDANLLIARRASASPSPKTRAPSTGSTGRWKWRPNPSGRRAGRRRR